MLVLKLLSFYLATAQVMSVPLDCEYWCSEHTSLPLNDCICSEYIKSLDEESTKSSSLLSESTDGKESAIYYEPTDIPSKPQIEVPFYIPNPFHKNPPDYNTENEGTPVVRRVLKSITDQNNEQSMYDNEDADQNDSLYLDIDLANKIERDSDIKQKYDFKELEFSLVDCINLNSYFEQPEKVDFRFPISYLPSQSSEKINMKDANDLLKTKCKYLDNFMKNSAKEIIANLPKITDPVLIHPDKPLFKDTFTTEGDLFDNEGTGNSKESSEHLDDTEFKNRFTTEENPDSGDTVVSSEHPHTTVSKDKFTTEGLVDDDNDTVSSGHTDKTDNKNTFMTERDLFNDDDENYSEEDDQTTANLIDQEQNKFHLTGILVSTSSKEDSQIKKVNTASSLKNDTIIFFTTADIDAINSNNDNQKNVQDLLTAPSYQVRNRIEFRNDTVEKSIEPSVEKQKLVDVTSTTEIYPPTILYLNNDTILTDQSLKTTDKINQDSSFDVKKLSNENKESVFISDDIVHTSFESDLEDINIYDPKPFGVITEDIKPLVEQEGSMIVNNNTAFNMSETAHRLKNTSLNIAEKTENVTPVADSNDLSSVNISLIKSQPEIKSFIYLIHNEKQIPLRIIQGPDGEIRISMDSLLFCQSIFEN